ncbi:hypothetical protein [Leptospira ilyithenensis]|uniref:Lipoprotein n=1 Tax=Leptospira ilyithenensis TaxID=2484901 RepID=A0A4R9LVK8_9LEPT|nr:hypothetical protein [Leptospira ilyithenensis]TGN13725.1 hypothetical protein EHS11_03630 [Leptospira ilyithenensis]
MNNLNKFGAIALILGLSITLSSCKEKEEDNTPIVALLYAQAQAAAAAAAKYCETTGKSLTSTDFPSATAICVPSGGSAKHFRIEGLEITGNTFYFNVGNATTDAAATIAALPTGNVAQLYFYPSFSTPAPIYAVRYAPSNAASGTRQNITGLSSAVTASAAATVCLDVNDAAPSRITVWVNGVNGASCSDLTTLTAATSVVNKKDWNSTVKLDSRNAFISFAAGAVGGTSKFTKVTAFVDLAVQD